MTVRVAIIADTHGFLDPRIAERIQDCDLAVHAGDVGGADVLNALRPRQRVYAVRGNNDTPERWPDGERELLATLPHRASVELPGGRLVVVHGDDGGGIEARHRRYRRRYADAAAVVYGHSHRLLTDFRGRPWVLNPGAAGRVRTYGGPSCLFLTCTDGAWTVEPLRLEPRRPVRRRQRRA